MNYSVSLFETQAQVKKNKPAVITDSLNKRMAMSFAKTHVDAQEYILAVVESEDRKFTKTFKTNL